MANLNGYHTTMLNGHSNQDDEENTGTAVPMEKPVMNPHKREMHVYVRTAVNAYNALNYISKLQNSAHFSVKFSLIVLKNKEILQKVVQWVELQSKPVNQQELIEYEAKKLAIARKYSQPTEVPLENNGQVFIGSENRAAFEAEIAPLNETVDYETMLVQHSENVEKLMSQLLTIQFYAIPTELLPEVGIPITAIEHIIFMLT